LFDAIGVTETELEDEETSKFIYNYVESHGGIEKGMQHLDRAKRAPGSTNIRFIITATKLTPTNLNPIQAGLF